MWDWLKVNLFTPFVDAFGSGLVFLLTHLSIILGLICAAVIFRRISEERRSPSNTLAWLMLVIFIPYIGVPLYLLFGGRKSRRKAKIKAEVSRYANALTERDADRKAGYTDYFQPKPDQVCSKGNHCELLPDGATTYRRLLDEIKQAEHTIHIATYILGNDKSGREITEQLSKRAKEGVTVRLLLDSLGSWNKSRFARHLIRKSGGEVAMFIPVLPLQTQSSSNLRNHRKIAIFDNYRAITGGQNLDNRFLGDWPDPDRFTDLSIVIQGPAVAEITRIFISDWAFAAKENPRKHKDLLRYIPEEAGNSTVEIIPSGPDVTGDPLWEQLLRMIQEFKRELTIVTPYFVPDELLLKSLIIKAHTGRRIRLILPFKSNQRLADIARFRALEELHKAGVEILLYTPCMMHGKLVLVDDLIALSGTANIDIRSLFVNFEIALASYTNKDIQKFAGWAKNIEKDCISYEEAIQREGFIPSQFSQDLVHFVVPLL